MKENKDLEENTDIKNNAPRRDPCPANKPNTLKERKLTSLFSFTHIIPCHMVLTSS